MHRTVSRFSIRNPYFIVVICLALMVIGVTSLVRMPVDLFPSINLPEVVVATFYSGMPPQDIETDITNPLERFFTLASGIDHMESRSLLGVSIIKVYFQPGTDADADVTELSNLALADLKRLPPGTLPPVVLKFDASSLPVCLVTLKGEGLSQTQLHDIGQFTIRNQIAVVKGAEIPPPFGGKYRQAMVYVDPYKLLSRQLSLMDVVDALNKSNLILPAGDVKMGPFDYYVYSNSLVKQVANLNQRSDQNQRTELGLDRRHRRSQGLQPDPVQHRSRGRPALRVPAHHEAGRRHQHHPGGERDPRHDREAVRYSEAAGSERGFRSIGFRERGDSDAAARRLDRTGAHQPDDSDFPRKLARHGGGVPVDSAIRGGYVRRPVPDGEHHQHDDSGRTGAGVFARDR